MKGMDLGPDCLGLALAESHLRGLGGFNELIAVKQLEQGLVH